MEKQLPLSTSINLEQLRENLDFIVESMSAYMCDCLIVCLLEENHNADALNKPVFISITEFSEPKSLFVKK